MKRIARNLDKNVHVRINVLEDKSNTFDVLIWDGANCVEVNCIDGTQARELVSHLTACGFNETDDEYNYY